MCYGYEVPSLTRSSYRIASVFQVVLVTMTVRTGCLILANGSPHPIAFKERERAVTQPDSYLLGRAEAEEERLKRQIANLAPDSDAQFDRIGIKPGQRVVDLGCGPGVSCICLASASAPRAQFLALNGALILWSWRAASSPAKR